MSRQHCETVFAQLYRLVTFVTISHVGLAAFCPLFWAQDPARAKRAPDASIRLHSAQVLRELPWSYN